MAWIEYDEALARTLAAAPTMGDERVALDDAAGRVLAETVDYPTDLPPFAQATMDGYAIGGAALAGARFLVRGESRAGAPLQSDGEGETESTVAVAISTGAALPPGIDTVLPWEDVERTGDAIVLRREAAQTQWTRRAGEDARAGSEAVRVGARLSPGHLAALATAERAQVMVARRPHVLLLVTGDELRTPGSAETPGTIADSNTPLLVALARRAGATVTRQHVADRAGALEAAIRAATADTDAQGGAASRADAIVTVGGAAEGEHDHVARALTALAAELVYRGVAIKPGKPVALARLGKTPILALPGNPGSAFVTFVLLGIPLLRTMQLDRAAAPRFVEARLLTGREPALRAPRERLLVHYGTLVAGDGTLGFHAHAAVPSGAIPPIAAACAFALVPAGTTVEPGALVRALDLEST